MNEKFDNLPEEKKQRIIDACMEEFAQNGYENASTNVIVKKAGISKGILFHYFGNKKNLFLYTIEYIMNYFAKEYISAKGKQPADIFDRLIWFGLWKLKIYVEQPLMSKMIATAFTFKSEKVEAELNDILSKNYAYYLTPLMEDIDTSKFREGVDYNKAIELINFFINGLSDKYMKMYENSPPGELIHQAEEIREEFNVYLDIIKFGAYGEKKGSTS